MSASLSYVSASAYVAVGGALGAVGRYQLGRAVTHTIGHQAASQFPWATFAANVVGCLLMGFLFGWLARHGGTNEGMRLFLGVGLLGGFTTFSAFSLEMLMLVERGAIGLAFAYAAGSVLAGLGAVFLGLAIMRATL